MKNALRFIAPLLDLAILIMVVIAMVMMLTGANGILSEGGIGFLKYFTVQSNLLMGIAALCSLPFDILLLAKKSNQHPLAIKILNFAGSIGVTLTFIVVMVWLGPAYGYSAMFAGANMFFHLIIPIASIIRIIFLEAKYKELKIKHTFFGIIHLAIYGVFYLINIAVNNGYGDINYDWYNFGRGGLPFGLLAFTLIIVATYGICVGIYFAQRAINKLKD